MMNLIMVLVLMLSYLIGGARAIRWAAKKSDQDAPKWLDAIGAMFWPAIIGKLVRWVIPDRWEWPEVLLAGLIGGAFLYFMLRLNFKIRTWYAVGVVVFVYVTALLVAFEVLPMIPDSPARH